MRYCIWDIVNLFCRSDAGGEIILVVILLCVFLFFHSIRSFCAAWLLSQRPVIMWDSAGKSMTGSRLGMAGYGLGQQTVRERKHGQSQGSIQADFWCCLTELPVPRFLVPAVRCNRSAQKIGPLTLAWTEITWGLTHNSRKDFNKALSFSTGWILQRMCESFVPFLAWYSMWYNGIVSYIDRVFRTCAQCAPLPGFSTRICEVTAVTSQRPWPLWCCMKWHQCSLRIELPGDWEGTLAKCPVAPFRKN